MRDHAGFGETPVKRTRVFGVVVLRRHSAEITGGYAQVDNRGLRLYVLRHGGPPLTVAAPVIDWYSTRGISFSEPLGTAFCFRFVLAKCW